MSLAAAFGKKSEVDLAASVPALLTAADTAAAAASSSDRKADGAHVGRKRGRRDMETAGSAAEGANSAAARPASTKAPQRRREWPEREARTVFVGGVPTSTTTKALALLFQAKLTAMRESGELTGPAPAAPAEDAGEADKANAAEAAKKMDDDSDSDSDADADGDDKSEGDGDDAAEAKAEGKEGEKKDADAKEGDAQNKDEGKDGKRPKKARKLTADIESIRFRSIPVAPVAIAPGADFKTMTKAAFIKKSFAEGRDAMNAYIVFTSQAAAKAALFLNNSLFEGRHLRVDRAGPREDGRKARYDPKRTVFVGQVHFEANEEELRSLFAGRISGGDGSIEAIRIVRDPATSKGKGIAYVLFTERTHVAEALGVNGASFKGRNLRVTRCVDMEKAPPIAPGDAAKKRLAAKGAAGRRGSSNGGPAGGAGGPQRGRLADGKKDRHRERPGSAAAGGDGAGAGSRPPREHSARRGDGGANGDRPRSAGPSRASSAAPPPAKRPAHMGATGAEVVSDKAAAERRKAFKGPKGAKGGRPGGSSGGAGGGGGKPRPAGKFGGGKPGGGKPHGGGGGKPGGRPGGGKPHGGGPRHGGKA